MIVKTVKIIFFEKEDKIKFDEYKNTHKLSYRKIASSLFISPAYLEDMLQGKRRVNDELLEYLIKVGLYNE